MSSEAVAREHRAGCMTAGFAGPVRNCQMWRSVDCTPGLLGEEEGREPVEDCSCQVGCSSSAVRKSKMVGVARLQVDKLPDCTPVARSCCMMVVMEHRRVEHTAAVVEFESKAKDCRRKAV